MGRSGTPAICSEANFEHLEDFLAAFHLRAHKEGPSGPFYLETIRGLHMPSTKCHFFSM